MLASWRTPGSRHPFESPGEDARRRARITATATSLNVGGVIFPSGHSLPERSWQRRHLGILILLACHVVGLAAFGIATGHPVAHSLGEAGIVAALTLLAASTALPRRARSSIAGLALMTCSAILVHFSGGFIEAHFHFFVTLGIIFLYEDWLPYFLAVGYVAVHHGVMGTLDPLSVYNHPSAIAAPWQWAGIHAIFIFGLSAALIVAWNVIERARISETKALSQTQELKRQLHTQEKMAALGSLVSGLAHEVRTPLTIVGTNASLLEIAAMKDPQNALTPRVEKHVRAIHENVDRINALVLQLKRFHALAPDEMETRPLDALVQEAVRLYQAANRSSRALKLELAPTPDVRVHALGLHQVVLNLLANASDATDPVSGAIVVRTRHEGGHAVLSVEDNGVGMDDATMRKAFDPLFTTKKDGMGLGLHIVQRIAEAHDAEIRVTSEPRLGTKFEVWFPLARQPVVVPVDAGVAIAPSATSA